MFNQDVEQVVQNFSLVPLLIHFAINTLVISIILKFFYYAKSKRRDYVFTFALISISIFLMIFLLGGVKLKIGFALGLFAIFGIIRYRTESMPVREMTYIFVIIAISVINALSADIAFLDIAITNLLFILAILVLEKIRNINYLDSKLVMYDRIENVKQENYDKLLEDLKERTGLDIERVEVGSIDFLKDSAMLKIFYKPTVNMGNSVNNLTKFPKDEE